MFCVLIIVLLQINNTPQTLTIVIITISTYLSVVLVLVLTIAKTVKNVTSSTEFANAAKYLPSIFENKPKKGLHRYGGVL
jgi:uncharacterized membrane protein YeiB